ncbi:MAG: putative rane protein [Actinomycetota bacterium]|nr:putative rane protein [Actinomycetota bacterium]
MLSLLSNVVVNAVAIWVATLIVPKVSIEGGTIPESFVALLVVGAALALVNAVVKPLVKMLTGCLYILTLGLMALVVNALMLKAAGWLAGQAHVSFDPGPFFWSTILAAVVVTLVSIPLNAFLDSGSDGGD